MCYGESLWLVFIGWGVRVGAEDMVVDRKVFVDCRFSEEGRVEGGVVGREK